MQRAGAIQRSIFATRPSASALSSSTFTAGTANKLAWITSIIKRENHSSSRYNSKENYSRKAKFGTKNKWEPINNNRSSFQKEPKDPFWELERSLPERFDRRNNNKMGQPEKRPHNGGQGAGKPWKRNKQPKQQKKVAGTGETVEEVLLADLEALYAKHSIADKEVYGESGESAPPLPAQGTEIEVEVLELSSTGEGLARQKGSPHVYVVPFAIPGDTVKVKAYRHVQKDRYTAADFIEVVKPSPLRDDSRIGCKYFAKCSGCQFQMMDYADQLRHKRDIVVKAYRNFSQLPPELVPDILDTIGSPLQYDYRTKLTPHFDHPHARSKKKQPLAEVPPIGFTPKTSRKVLDIEDCPIATEAVRKGLTAERQRMQVEYPKYTKGATILLRESTKRVPKQTPDQAVPVPEGIPADAVVRVETDRYVDFKTCETDQNATSTEYIDDFIFTNPAGSFFQNNNSILPPFTDYIRQHILPKNLSSSEKRPIRNLIDAYSGSGLFTITQASLFPGGSVGIDIAEKSIEYARRNAELNGLSAPGVRFLAADAPELFKVVDKTVYDPDETVVVLDPPRKGCDASFLRQLLAFAPTRVVYVSCNVHTQARDVGILVRGEVDGWSETLKKLEGGEEEKKAQAPTSEEEEMKEVAEANGEEVKKEKKVRYEIESIRGFDFFPQTGHVEGVAILNRVDE